MPLKALRERLPETNGPMFPRLTRLKTTIVSAARERSPEWIEHDGNFTFLLKTNVASDWLDALVDRVPERLIDYWLKFAIIAMAAMLLVWAVLLLGGLFLAVRTVWALTVKLVEWAANYDWLSLLEQQPQPQYDPMGAIRRAGASVDSYGLLLLGPLLGGAFVSPGDDAEDLKAERDFEIWSAGIANSLIWGSILLSCGLLLSGEPAAVIQALFGQQSGIFLDKPVSSILLAIGMVEVANSFVNAVPFGPVDGGGFVRTAEEELWDLEESTAFDERIKQLLSADSTGDLA
jgi:hypothetical protein